ncbi:MAG: hypothetical protein J6X89_02210 [Bacteroidales bacterium]|nr:hypothetical protein [Bacteroidales bacterium]
MEYRFFTKLIIGLLSLSVVVSCQKDDPNDYPARLVIADMDWTEAMKVDEVATQESKSYINITVNIGWNHIVNEHIGGLVVTSKPNKYQFDICTPAESFAVEKIAERNKDIQEYFDANFDNGAHGWWQDMSTVYMREVPQVYADKPLFGKEAGENLVSFFKYSNGSVIFRTVGLDYKVTECAPARLLTDYFSEWTNMPRQFIISSTVYPEELNTDDDINITFVFPVVIEHYWSWLLELYENPDAEEVFTDMDMTFSASLKDLKVRHDIPLQP